MTVTLSLKRSTRLSLNNYIQHIMAAHSCLFYFSDNFLFVKTMFIILYIKTNFSCYLAYAECVCQLFVFVVKCRRI